MASLRRKNKSRERAESTELGFGTVASAQRVMNADGTYNYIRHGLPWWENINVYHFLISCRHATFFGSVILWYTLVNLIFTGLYYWAGIEHLTGLAYRSQLELFEEIYFFSAQTLTTVGYGRINPTGFAASLVSSAEALVGLMSFAIITGLLYARFAKPKAVLMFTDKAVVGPYKDGLGLMFRVANKLNSNLINMQADVNLSLLKENAAGEKVRQFYSALPLERASITFFPSNWTIVHPIDPDSPFWGMNWEDFQAAKPEVLVLISGFDETFDENVYVRRSYAIEDLIWGGKFQKMTHLNPEGLTVIDFDKLNTIEIHAIDTRIEQPIQLP